ncbi:ATP-binding protein [Mesorhizobium dulcispinae]|uniref:ATP-binding protein n=1 Tax=Mesorhizobium dulcispinae TaxID=3072316 RepID=UPI002A246459|nr:winged helix-turn-helix domain-containing protein [Mesorhizobium sp. VK23D]MDX8518202.1 winged helix-turn-helix domain-containing protein [Mesorhizobium sp. VK23D]
MTITASQAKDGLSFGPFCLAAGERLLTREGAPVELGSRALEILIVLTSAPNEVVSKKDLMSRVWPDVVVEEGSLRFHMTGLRKALGDGKDGARYIATLPGRGYCFVAPVSRSSSPHDEAPFIAAGFRHANLPNRLSRMVGRDEDVLKLSAQLNASRFVTIVGAGGVGKTTVAIAVGHHLIDAFYGAVLFVDLGMIGDPGLVTTAVASMLGLTVQTEDATPNLIAYLRNKRILLILDTCEHLLDAVAPLAASIVDAASQVHILATSREALRVEGEHIYRLDALAYPPDEPGLTAAIVQTFPATQLFVERAVAGGARLDVSDAEALLIASICRKLDGVALSIELAARRVESYGLQQTAALLDQRLTLLWLGSRIAPPRQQTLQATLDWSFGLLSDLERVVLRRLAVFVGHFTLDAALEVVTSATLDRSTVLGAMDSLVAKSMVATRPVGAMMRYRLLDTTRAYVLDIRIDDAEAADLAVRHAAYFRRWLGQTGMEWPRLATGEERAPHFAAIDNVRAALLWCFSDRGNADIGIGLVTAAAPVFLAMSLLPECHRWSERAILAFDNAALGGLDEMHLQAALGVSFMFMRGGRHRARAALERSLAIAEQRGDPLDRVRLLGPLNMFHLRTGNFVTALEFARRCSATAAGLEDSVAIALAHSILGISLHLRGDLAEARAELEAALDRGPRSQRTTTIYLGFEGKILARAILARNLWLQGHPDQATAHARQAVEEAAAMDHSLTLAIALIWAISVFLWTGDLKSAEAYIDMLIARAESHSMTPYLLVGRGFKSEVAIRQGDAKGGVEGLQTSIQNLHAAPYELLTTPLNLSLVRGLSSIGQVDEASALIDESLDLVEKNGDQLYLPELLRMKGSLLLQSQRSRDEAAAYLMQALELSRSQHARAWELRTAIDMTALMAGRGEINSARELLQPVAAHFVEGLNTADVKAAEHLLATLR